MKRTRLLLGASALAVCALLAANTVGVAAVVPAPAPRYVAPTADQGLIRVAGLFGESDEEKAARLQHEADQDAQIKALGDRVRDLEDSLRGLTGQNEELGHRVTELSDKIERQQKDFEYRLCALSAQQLGAAMGQGDANAVPCPGSAPAASAAPAFSSGASAATQAPPQQQGQPSGVLGTLPAGTQTATPAPPAPADDAAQAEFAAAMNLLAKARYDDARAAFRGFADAHPASDLAPQAIYWDGDIAYVQKDYDGATRLFAEVIKKYPTSARAPDSMLKLGQALIASGDKKGGCTALAALPLKYPKAAKSLLAQGAETRKASCRGAS
jgi:tol-pal system protein YbgF